MESDLSVFAEASMHKVGRSHWEHRPNVSKIVRTDDKRMVFETIS